MTTPTVELVPGDDFSLTVTITDANGDAIDYSGWSIHTAQITWDDDTTTDLDVDLSNADTGVFVLTCADTETDGKRLGLVHELRLKLQLGAGLERTVYYAEVKGVKTLTSDTATGFVPGLNAEQVKEFYEANSDTNAFTDAEKSKLAGIASGAEVNTVDSVNGLTGAVVLDPDDLDDTATTNKFTTAANISKLAGIEAGATADQTGAEIKALYETEADTNAYTDAEKTKLAGIEASADVTDAANVAAAGAVMDGDFATNGLMKRTGAGTYDSVTDNSANWNAAYGWGDHAAEGYLTSVAVGDLTDWPASVSTTEIGYLDGVTSAIQTQLNAKASLSGATFTGSISTASVDLNAIYETKAVTAVDVFVYDTSRDSDGGAWRKRCQHTSWYNEELNTATRGSRRDFPAVAVIVADSNKITIYDGDDTDLPMWMVFTLDNTAPKGFPNGNSGVSISGVAALNGILLIPTKNGSGGGLNIATFIEDAGYVYFSHSTYLLYGKYNGSLGQRDQELDFTDLETGASSTIVNNQINDVAMTVLPDNGLDVATGLPKVDIAVATDGNGTYLASVIRADGNVYDVGADGGSTAVSVSLDGAKLTLVRANGTVFVWNDIGEINADGATPDATYSATSTPAILGTATKVAA